MNCSTLSNGAQGVDTDVTVTLPVAQALLAAGKTFLIRSIGHTPQFEHDNLSSSELTLLTNAGLRVGIYQMWRTSGWTAAQGTIDGNNAVAQASAANYPQGCFIAVDLEGNNMGPDVMGYAVAWAKAVRAAGYSPWAYIGPGIPLSSAELGELYPSFDGFWHSGAIVPEVTGHSYSMFQAEQADVKFGGTAFDLDSITNAEASPRFASADVQVAPAASPSATPVAVHDPNVPIAMLPIVPGEKPADRIIRILRSYVGCSLSNRRADLGELVSRGVDKPEVVVTIATNCATSALGIMAKAGVHDAILNRPYQSGMAVGWVRQVGLDLGALVKYAGPKGPQPKAGSLLRYNTPGKNDDHVEWLTSDIDAAGNASHAGGGRADNAISEGTGPVLSSWGRPLVEFLDPDKLGIPFVPFAPVVVDPPTGSAEGQGALVSATGNVAGTSLLMTIWNFIVMLISVFTKKAK